MNETQETNATGGPRQIDWSLLRPYGRGLEVMGWAIVAFFFYGCVGMFYYNFFLLDSLMRADLSLYRMFAPGLRLSLRQEFFPGVILLVLAQLMRCLGDRECPPGWVLRHGHWILFLYEALLLEYLGLRCYNFFAYGPATGEPNSVSFFVTMNGLPIFVQSIIVLGAALMLRRLVSIIEESKTLV